MELIVDGKNVLKPVDLDKEKKALLAQRESVPSNVSLTHFDEKKWLFDTHVTGEQGNELVTQIQACFSDINARQIVLFKEVDSVLGTIESIHKGSIEGIVVGIKSAQNAIEQSDYAIDQIRQTLEILSAFKTQLEENTEHLNDIDTIWDATINLAEDCDRIENSLKEEIAKISGNVEILHKFKKSMEKYQHLKDVDWMYDELKKHEEDIIGIKGDYDERIKKIDEDVLRIKEQYEAIVNRYSELDIKVSNNREELDRKIEALSQYKEAMEQIEHIKDIDFMFDKVNLHTESIAAANDQFNEKLLELAENQSNEIKRLNEKLKVVYYLLGGTASILIIQLLLNLMGII